MSWMLLIYALLSTPSGIYPDQLLALEKAFVKPPAATQPATPPRSTTPDIPVGRTVTKAGASRRGDYR